MTRVFLTGGSGLIGGALAARLAERGDEVVALARSHEAERTLGGVRARQRHHLVAALDQALGERAADQAAAPGQEDARHVSESARASTGIARTR